KDRVAGQVGGGQGLFGSAGAIAGSKSGSNRRPAKGDSKRGEFTPESKRSRKTQGVRTVSERNRPNEQERSRLEAIGGTGGDSAATLKVSKLVPGLAFSIDPSVFWPYAAGAAILVIGLPVVTMGAARPARGLDKLVAFGPLLFGIAVAV